MWPISHYCKHLEVLAANSQEKRDKGTWLSKERHPTRQAASARASSSRLYLRLRSGVSPRACCLQGRTAELLVRTQRSASKGRRHLACRIAIAAPESACACAQALLSLYDLQPGQQAAASPAFGMLQFSLQTSDGRHSHTATALLLRQQAGCVAVNVLCTADPGLPG